METTRGPIERDGGHHPRHGSTSQLHPSKACRQFRGAIRTRSGRRGHPPRRHLQASAIWEASCHGIRAARERSTGDRGSDFGAADSQRRAEQGVEKPTRGRGPGGGIVAVTVFSSAARIRLRVASYCRRGLRARRSWRPLANSMQTELRLGLGRRHRPLFTFVVLLGLDWEPQHLYRITTEIYACALDIYVRCGGLFFAPFEAM